MSMSTTADETTTETTPETTTPEAPPPPPQPPRPVCLHCKARDPYRRSLCRVCYFDLGIRERYPRKKTSAPPAFDGGRKGKSVSTALCRTCGERPGNRRRGCCRTCYLTRGLGRGAESPFKTGRRQPHAARAGDGLSQHSRPLPPEPTDALPGTDEKMAVMQERDRLGYHIHHPHDARRDDVRDPSEGDFQPQTVREPRALNSLPGKRGSGPQAEDEKYYK
jgi:hypothetical protein